MSGFQGWVMSQLLAAAELFLDDRPYMDTLRRFTARYNGYAANKRRRGYNTRSWKRITLGEAHEMMMRLIMGL